MSASNVARTPVTLPSASAASSMSWTWPRPWMVDRAASERSSVHRTGFWWCLARTTASCSSAYMSSLLPNPPPTDGATTRILCSGVPVVAATRYFRMWGIWVAE